MPRIVEILAKMQEKDGKTSDPDRLVRAKKGAELAVREVNEGFPLVYAQGVVGLWSLLEALIQQFVSEWIANDPTALQCEAVAKLRIRLGEYEQLSQAERFYYIASQLERETAAGIRNGVERFEALLRPFKLDGPVPKKLAREIFEFGQVRNAIVHVGGVTDRQLSESCPWLELAAGSTCRVSEQMFSRYVSASHYYVILLICRVGEYFGKDVAKEKEDIFARYAEH